METKIQSVELLDKLLSFWFPNQDYNDFWFDGSKDEYIKKEFSSVLTMAENKELESWKLSQNGILALVILYDQITRNIHRSDEILRKKNDAMALEMCLLLINDNYDLKYPLYQRIFFLLPLRHQRITSLLNLVMHRISFYESTEKKTILLDKFKLATLKNYGDVYDSIEEVREYTDKFIDNHSDILDTNCLIYRHKLSSPITETKNLDNLTSNSLVNNIDAFYFTMAKPINIGISLSGGVDSMVMLYISKYLELTKKINKVVAIHLEYTNRPESKYESEFIINWCKYLQVPIYIRKVTHMQRDNGTIDRNFYEEETKRIRFNLYKYVVKKELLLGIGMGHHYGDLGENVLMNIFKGRELLDLFVMENKSIIDNILLLRPMLGNKKEDIYNFAHQFCIPYMKDSTPDWSCRGVIRRKIMPTLINQYGEGIYKNLAKLGEMSKQWDTVVNNFVLEPILKTIQYGRLGAIVPLTPQMLELPEVIWTKILITLFHRMGIKMISHKSLASFLEWINNAFHSENYHMYKFSNKTMGRVFDNELHIYSETLLQNKIPLENINITENFTKKINNWEIKITEIKEINPIQRINPRNIILGHYVYTICLTNNTTSLINSFEKKDYLRKTFSDINYFKNNIPIIKSEMYKPTSTQKYYQVSVLYL